jgi:hypothetical protein
MKEASVGEKLTWGLPQRAGNKRGVHRFTGEEKGLRKSEASAINKGSSPLNVVMLYFTAFIPLLVEETNHYYHQYFDKWDKGPSSPLPGMTTSELFLL